MLWPLFAIFRSRVLALHRNRRRVYSSVPWKCFLIQSTAENFDNSLSVKEKYLNYLERIQDDEIEDPEAWKDFNEWVLEPFEPIFRGVPLLPANEKYTLQQYLFPEIIFYTLRSVDGKLVPVPQSEEKQSDRLPFGVKLPQELCSPWSSIHPKHIRYGNGIDHMHSCDPRRAFIDGDIPRRYFFRFHHLAPHRTVEYELTKYASIRDAGLDHLRIPQLYGIVQDDAGLVYGLLFSHIDSVSVNLRYDMAVEEAPTDLRERWISQITDTLQDLHDAGITWGNAKPDNVMIDVNNDAWLIEFGGGHEGWVEEEMEETLAGTVKGDLQGLAKIVAYIQSSAVEKASPETTTHNEIQ
ncbi:hypothetical protein BU24DRAFT_454425 [Aaosphaeria arxii CBS 175.79]|uniref:Protein kinase domain-containing protein n=1 Tax=Aaosphaeria arxii CBS 175.79 TaxID=1450172 RepID=A0A6A5XD08_9PLEO|nr:uncharacterized protein BU24DRAFT_454425 [Aaosphaeria arxii CBS 175.79]KAF2010882.1 hypothetical protein BU24DRAFT_454425 [Aaosphaeria arxii CBS 175.79]